MSGITELAGTLAGLPPGTTTFLMNLLGGGGGGGGGGEGSQKMAAAGMPAEIFKTAMGIDQAIKASRFAKTPRPEYTIPGAIKEATGTARQLANTGLPGYDIMRGNIGAGAASGMRQIKEVGGSGPEKMAAISGMAGSQMAQQRQLDIQNASQRLQNMRNLQTQLTSYMAPYQDKAWTWNKRQPFEDAMAAAARLRDAANQNIYGGMKGMGTAAGLMMGGGEEGSSKSGGVSGNMDSAESGILKKSLEVFGKKGNNKPTIQTNPPPQTPQSSPIQDTQQQVIEILKKLGLIP